MIEEMTLTSSSYFGEHVLFIPPVKSEQIFSLLTMWLLAVDT